MKAIAYNGNSKPLSVEDLPTPEPGPGQLLLKVNACGICGSDLHAYQASMSPEGIVFGHEFASEVAALGEVPDAFSDLMKPNSHCKVMIEPQRTQA